MAARSIGSGTISFGLVAIPVKLFSTVDTTKAVRFNYLSKDGSRLKQQYIKSSDGEVVEREDRVQGYEFAKGQYVLFSEEEIKAMYVESSNAIDIAEFIPVDEVDRLYIEKVYYLGPDKGAARSYHLLKAALENSGRAALARYAARGRSHLVLIRPHGRGDETGLIMEQLKHADELRPFADVPLDACSIEDGELELALTIIEQRLNDEFRPENYEDEVRSRMMERIQQKIDGQEVVLPPEEAPEAKIIDLMEALKASVGKTSETKAPATKPASRTAAKSGQKTAAKAAAKTGSKSTAKPAKRAAKRDDQSAAKAPVRKASRKKR